MKKFIEMSWDNKDYNPLSILKVVSNGSKVYMGDGIERFVIQEGIFDFINDCVEVKGYTETFNMLVQTYWGNDIRGFIKDHLYPAVNGDYSLFLDLLKNVAKENPELLKETLINWNKHSHFNDEVYLDELRIKANEIYLNLPGVSSDYLWEAKAKVLDYFKKSGIVSEANKPDPFKLYCSLVDDIFEKNKNEKNIHVNGYAIEKKYLMLGLSPDLSINALLSNFGPEIKKGIYDLVVNKSLNEDNMQYASVFLNSKTPRDKEFNEIALEAFKLKKDLILNSWNGYKIDNTWIFNSSAVIVQCILEETYKNTLYTHSYDEIKKLNDSVSKNDLFGLMSSAGSHLKINEINAAQNKIMENVLLSHVKNFDKDVTGSFVNEVLNSDSLKFTGFGVLPDNEESFALKRDVSFKNIVEYISVGDAHVKNLSTLVFLAESVDLTPDSKKALEEMKIKVLDKIVKNFDVFKGANMLDLLAIVYDENKEKVQSILKNPDILTEVAMSPTWTAKKRGKDSDYTQEDPWFLRKMDNMIAKKSNCFYSASKDKFKKNILEIVIFNKDVNDRMRELSRDSVKNLILVNDKEFTEMIISNPEKYFDVVMTDKKMNKIVTSLPPKHYEKIMESMMSINNINKAVKNPSIKLK